MAQKNPDSGNDKVLLCNLPDHIRNFKSADLERDMYELAELAKMVWGDLFDLQGRKGHDSDLVQRLSRVMLIADCVGMRADTIAFKLHLLDRGCAE